jgi:hypothetical protein
MATVDTDGTGEIELAEFRAVMAETYSRQRDMQADIVCAGTNQNNAPQELYRGCPSWCSLHRSEQDTRVGARQLPLERLQAAWRQRRGRQWWCFRAGRL